jgi:ribulose-5-phosphate 4-epimerase/fuculose-1-phosphate aldolase
MSKRSKQNAYTAIFDRLQPPKPASVAEERQWRKERLAGGLRIFAALGLAEGAGHVTARDPEFLDTFWVNPFGMGFDRIRVSDLIRVDERGEIVEGSGPLIVSAFAIHAQIHAARPEVVAAAHTHSIYGKAWSAVGRLLDPITQDACAFFEDHVFFDDTKVLITEASEGSLLARGLATGKPGSYVTMASSQLAKPWTRQSGSLCRWSDAARRNS